MAGISELYNAVAKGVKHIVIDGDLNLSRLTIDMLPDNLTVTGSLHLGGSSDISALPDHLTIGNDLFLKGTSITTLPDNLSVGRHIYLSGTGITTVPSNLAVGGKVFGLEDNRRLLDAKISIPSHVKLDS